MKLNDEINKQIAELSSNLNKTGIKISEVSMVTTPVPIAQNPNLTILDKLKELSANLNELQDELIDLQKIWKKEREILEADMKKYASNGDINSRRVTDAFTSGGEAYKGVIYDPNEVYENTLTNFIKLEKQVFQIQSKLRSYTESNPEMNDLLDRYETEIMEQYMEIKQDFGMREMSPFGQQISLPMEDVNFKGIAKDVKDLDKDLKQVFRDIEKDIKKEEKSQSQSIGG